MMIADAKIAPQSSLLLVMDRDTGSIPETMGEGLVSATPSCIAVGTQAAGETSLLLTNERTCAGADPGMRRVFSGLLATPKKEVQVCTVLLEPVLSLAVSGVETKVEIWADHETEPGKLCVLVDS